MLPGSHVRWEGSVTLHNIASSLMTRPNSHPDPLCSPEHSFPLDTQGQRWTGQERDLALAPGGGQGPCVTSASSEHP